MLKVFKYQIPIGDYVEIDLPEGAEILSVDSQFDIPCMWALVNPDAPIKTRRFRFAGTGHPIKENRNELLFHGTFKMRDGMLIFHIFEIL